MEKKNGSIAVGRAASESWLTNNDYEGMKVLVLLIICMITLGLHWHAEYEYKKVNPHFQIDPSGY